MFDALRITTLFFVGLALPLEHLNILKYITPNKLVVGMLLVVVAFQWASTGRPIPRNAKTPWVLFFAVSIGISAVSGLVQGSPLIHVFDTTLTLLLLVLFYFLITYTVSSVRAFDALTAGFLIGVPLVATSALLGIGEATTPEGKPYKREVEVRQGPK